MNNDPSCFRVIFATNDRGYRFLKVAVHTLVMHVDPAKTYEICCFVQRVLAQRK